MRNSICTNYCISKSGNGGRVDDGEFLVRPQFIGNNVLLYGQRASVFPYQAVIGPDWSCMIITYILIIVPSFFFLLDVGTVIGPWVIVVGLLLCIASLM